MLFDREFQSALGFRDSAFVNRIFQLFDKNEDNAINFNEFICGLSVLSIRGTLEEKLQCTSLFLCVDGSNHFPPIPLSNANAMLLL